jgi:outer membrane protein OmpA-like peptidoglycan-associated protein
MLAENAPQGVELSPAEILAPRAAVYSWTAARSQTGVIALSGMLPNAESAARLLAAGGDSATSTVTYASGEPEGFLASAETALALLRWLQEGRIVYDGLGWTITGTAKSAIDKAAIDADFTARQLAAAGWSMAVAEPAKVIPEISPYRWSATRTASGVSLLGHVPAAPLKSDLAVQAGEAVNDGTELGLGAPENFAAAATAGLDAVLALEEGEVRLEGAQWSLGGRAASESQRDTLLAALAAAVDTTDWSIAISAPAPEPVATVPYVWSATKSADGAMMLSGLVAAEPTQRFLVVRAGGNVTDQSTVDPSAPEGFATDQIAALDMLAALTDGRASFDGQAWTVTGTLADAASQAAVDAALATATTPAADWTLTLAGPPSPEPAELPVLPPADTTPPEAPVEAAPEPAPQTEITPEPAQPEPAPTVAVPEPTPPIRSPADISACAAAVAEFSTRNAILFQSGAALIAAESETALDELAGHLAACPDATVHIEGHTDADGDDALNMALSVARAEAVVNALVSRGVIAGRLYAVGYGETAPIADNGTAQGKQLNRRIVVTVQPEHY